MKGTSMRRLSLDKPLLDAMAASDASVGPRRLPMLLVHPTRIGIRDLLRREKLFERAAQAALSGPSGGFTWLRK
jgi:hypothetical protein